MTAAMVKELHSRNTRGLERIKAWNGKEGLESGSREKRSALETTALLSLTLEGKRSECMEIEIHLEWSRDALTKLILESSGFLSTRTIT